jgi:uncharacterized protein DUF4126
VNVFGAPLPSFLTATSFAAGLNVYATVATLGILARTGVLTLPSQLSALRSPYVIGAALVLFAVEFVADKIPFLDLIWNALQTFVRVPVAVLLAFRETQHLGPEAQLLSALLGGAIAFVAHTGKTAARAAVTPSPEPISNFALSFAEDAGAIFLTWLATRHPYVAAAIALCALAAVVILFRVVVRFLRHLAPRARARAG